MREKHVFTTYIYIYSHLHHILINNYTNHFHILENEEYVVYTQYNSTTL